MNRGMSGGFAENLILQLQCLKRIFAKINQNLTVLNFCSWLLHRSRVSTELPDGITLSCNTGPRLAWLKEQCRKTLCLL